MIRFEYILRDRNTYYYTGRDHIGTLFPTTSNPFNADSFPTIEEARKVRDAEYRFDGSVYAIVKIARGTEEVE